MFSIFSLFWMLVFPLAAPAQQASICQHVIVTSQPVEEIPVCPAPVTTYVSEDESGWQVQIWDNATANNPEPVIAVSISEDAPHPPGTVLLDRARRGGVHVLLYQLETGDYEVLAGPDATGQMYALVFSLPPDSQPRQQEFMLAE